MSGPIVRTGATPKFWDNYDNIFGEKKAAAKSTKKAAQGKATAKAAAKKKAAPKAAAKKKAVKKKAAKKK